MEQVAEKRLGIEVEFTGVKREAVIQALENLFQSEREVVYKDIGSIPYNLYRVRDYYGNRWVIARDRSIKSEVYSSITKFDLTAIADRHHEYACEIITPVLTSETLPVLFSVLDVIRAIGGVVNTSCGIHIHVDKLDTKSTISLLKKFILMQDEIYGMFEVNDKRLCKYCKRFSEDTCVPDFDTEEELLYWYHENFSDTLDGVKDYKTSRYYGLNLHSIQQHNTLEFRLFNSSLYPADVAKYIAFVLSFCYEFGDISSYRTTLDRYLLHELEKGV